MKAVLIAHQLKYKFLGTPYLLVLSQVCRNTWHCEFEILHYAAFTWSLADSGHIILNWMQL